MSLQECRLSPVAWVEVRASVHTVLIIHHTSSLANKGRNCSFLFFSLPFKLTCSFGAGDLSSHDPRQSCGRHQSPDVQERTCGLDREEEEEEGGDKNKDRDKAGMRGVRKVRKKRWKDKQRGAKLELLSGVKELVKLLTQPSKSLVV